MSKIRKQKLNLFMLKASASLTDIVRDDVKGIREYQLSSKLPFEGRLLTKANDAHPPAWKRFVQTGTDTDITAIFSQNASALLGLQVDGRIFCFVFGYSRHWIPEDQIEGRFGIITTLNCVDHDSLRAVDREEFEAISRTTRSQVSVSSSMNVFGINPQRDLIRSVAGKPKDKAFGDFVAGADNLVFSAPIEFHSLAEKCSTILKLYESVDYQTAYPWIDNFRRVKSKSQVAKLDDLLVAKLQSEDHDKIYLSPPNLTDPTDPMVYRYPGDKPDAEDSDDLRLAELFSRTGKAGLNLEWLSEHKFKEISLSSDAQVREFSVYKALIFEVSSDGKLYVLSRGEWFEVALGYVARVEQDIAALTTNVALALPDALHSETEGAYNARTASESQGHLFCLDAKPVMFGGGYSRIEVCDLLTAQCDLIHVKAKTKSSTLSHLFTQGVIAAQMMRDQEFRKAAATNHLVVEDVSFLNPDSFNPLNFPVTFCIITSSEKELKEELPFLSKQSLSNALRELRLMGYPVFLNKIRAQAA